MRHFEGIAPLSLLSVSLILAACSSSSPAASTSPPDAGSGGGAGGGASAGGNAGTSASVSDGGGAGAVGVGGTVGASGAGQGTGGTTGAGGGSGTAGSGGVIGSSGAPSFGGATGSTDAGGARSSCKRGVAYGFDPASAPADIGALASGVSWFYGWATKPSPAMGTAYQKLGVEFVPMVWGGTFDVNKVVSEIPAGAKYLLGFNEPNFYSQANLTPAAAAALWPKMEQIAQQRNLKLVSPAINYCGGGCNVTNPFDWMDQFFAACTSCQIDYVAVHWYACTKSALSGYIDGFKKYGKPIWLTEFSCGDQGTQPVATQQAYMKDALAYLEGNPDVFRYAWFSGRTTAIANVDLLAGSGALTTLGGDYVSLPQASACTTSP